MQYQWHSITKRVPHAILAALVMLYFACQVFSIAIRALPINKEVYLENLPPLHNARLSANGAQVEQAQKGLHV